MVAVEAKIALHVAKVAGDGENALGSSETEEGKMWTS